MYFWTLTACCGHPHRQVLYLVQVVDQILLRFQCFNFNGCIWALNTLIHYLYAQKVAPDLHFNYTSAQADICFDFDLFWLLAKSICQILAIWAWICCGYSHIFVIFLKTKEGTAKLSINLSFAWTQLSNNVCYCNSTYFFVVTRAL